MSRLDALRAKLAETEAARDAAAAALTAEDREELELRRALARAEDERRKEQLARIELDLERRAEAAREEHGPDARIGTLLCEQSLNSFVLMFFPRKFEEWETKIAASRSNKKIKTPDVSRELAVASVIDWNGITDWNDVNESDTTHGHALNEFMRKNPGIVTSIVNKVAELGEAFAEERKS